MVKRSIIRYFGSKWLLAPWIISFFPKHKIYIEPFGGGANILLRKPFSDTEIYNDIDTEIFNFFQVMKNESKKLLEKLKWVPYHRDIYKQAYQETEDPIQLALNTLIKSFQGFGSESIFRYCGYRIGKRTKGQSSTRDWVNYENHIESFRVRLKHVILENTDAFELIKKHDSEETLYYLDPPYCGETRNLKHRYRHDCIKDEGFHHRMIKMAREGKGYYLISGYDNELYRNELKGWSVFSCKHFADGANERREFLWLSPNIEIDKFVQDELF